MHPLDSGGYGLGPDKTYILKGAARTYAIETRAVSDDLTIKKGFRKGVRGTDGPLLIARNPFPLEAFSALIMEIDAFPLN